MKSQFCIFRANKINGIGPGCRFGKSCKNRHDFPTLKIGEKICIHHLKGKCKFGKKCKNIHIDTRGYLSVIVEGAGSVLKGGAYYTLWSIATVAGKAAKYLENDKK